jgi:O-antigen ligase/tetratricopeptide (TPR) repeat protein
MQSITRFLRGVVVVGAFLMPAIALVFSSDIFFPYVTGKNFAFRIIAEVMFVAWVGLALLSTESRLKRSPVVWACASFTGIMGLATVFSVEPLRSFWSVFERMEGYITLLHLGAYFVALASIVRGEKMWRSLFYVMLGMSVVVGVGGLLELSETDRVAGVLGNAAYLGAYAMLHAGLALFLLVRKDMTRVNRYIYGAIAFFNVWVMYNTATRGAILGFFVGALCAAFCYVFFVRTENERVYRSISGGIIVLFVVLGGVFFMVRDSSYVTENRVLRRFASISLEDKTTRSRLILWGLTLDGWKEKPLLGWGQENFDYVFLKYYDPRLYDQEPFFDRAHNIFLDWLIAGGILGLLGYLSLYVALIYMIWKSGMSAGQKSILTGLVAGYFTQNLFAFDTITSYLFFVTILSYIHAISPRGEQKTFFPVLSITASPYILIGVVGIGCILPWSINGSGIRMSRDIITGYHIVTPFDLSENFAAWARTETEGYLGLSEARAQSARTADDMNHRADISDEDTRMMYEIAKERMIKKCEDQAGSARPYFTTAMFFVTFEKYDEAIVYLKKAIALAPKKDQFIRALALVYERIGDYDNAVDTILSAYEANPENGEVLAVYLRNLIDAGRTDEARVLFASVAETVDLPYPSLLQKFVSADMKEEALNVLNDIIVRANQTGELSPEMYFLKASLFVQLGKEDDARVVLREAEELFPETKEKVRVYMEEL